MPRRARHCLGNSLHSRGPKRHHDVGHGSVLVVTSGQGDTRTDCAEELSAVASHSFSTSSRSASSFAADSCRTGPLGRVMPRMALVSSARRRLTLEIPRALNVVSMIIGHPTPAPARPRPRTAPTIGRRRGANTVATRPQRAVVIPAKLDLVAMRVIAEIGRPTFSQKRFQNFASNVPNKTALPSTTSRVVEGPIFGLRCALGPRVIVVMRSRCEASTRCPTGQSITPSPSLRRQNRRAHRHRRIRCAQLVTPAVNVPPVRASHRPNHIQRVTQRVHVQTVRGQVAHGPV